ncbi:bifunctional DNA-formamidopyrimidine glycosylase/DNA-(apurinic or apyrimidinic site) lyase [Candidatus Bipolaricaulota bacterium]|nr:bifunctional DNA-formamidopyrimidine glycosylase/DNA-(apurinic or apyrimidinic site) lyase [Candidatus Bipolaricaulota bacterium]
MPELPEVETIVRGLQPMVGSRIVRVAILDSRLEIGRQLDDADADLRNQTVESITRRGKYIHVALSGGGSIVVHLRMSGRLVSHCTESDLPYVRLRLELDRGMVSFVNPRRLGTVDFSPDGFPHTLGIDPLSPEFTPDRLASLVQASRMPIKQFLLDQQRIAGLGNIYSSEALWRARIDPRRSANGLAKADIRRLHRGIVGVLQEAIDHMGTSFGVSVSDYRNAEGANGRFQERLAVYGRQGEACRVCETPISRCVQGGRSTYWCDGCQS